MTKQTKAILGVTVAVAGITAMSTGDLICGIFNGLSGCLPSV